MMSILRSWFVAVEILKSLSNRKGRLSLSLTNMRVTDSLVVGSSIITVISWR